MARAGEREVPAVAAPAALRRFVNFAKLPDPALDVARRVLDEDEAFRARVAASVTEEAVGRPGWVFLTRPDGWQAELDGFRKQAAVHEVATREDRSEREAQRRLAGAEAALARTETAALAATTEAERMRRELEEQRANAGAMGSEVDRLRAELAQVVEERRDTVRRLKEAEGTAQARSGELRTLRHE
ncbi:MAG: hypothetical protein H0W25_03640, partial [Acidimicrobiia bacterium]|nr:hypothetical protein [Acidimicrobiia bacterium]